MSKKLKVIHVVSEIAPFSKTGGLGDVARSLPKALFLLGHDVSVITPLYGRLINKEKYNLKIVFKDIKVVVDSENSFRVNFWQGELVEGLKVYFVEIKELFSRYKKIYVPQEDNSRFLVFNLASLKLISLLEEKPDIIHCHDWHTGLIPYYIKIGHGYAKKAGSPKTIFTIHNLIFQMGQAWNNVSLEKKDYGRKKIPKLNDLDINNINFAKRAILSADLINTVSEQYREEIMTKKFGQDLNRILKNREDRLFGIVNGIDYSSYNPLKDEGLFRKYGLNNLFLKAENKKYLQRKLNFNIDEDIPFFCFTSRLTHQKGLNIILTALPHLLKLDIQIAFMGDGQNSYIKTLKSLSKKYPKKISWMPFNQKMETLFYAASDFFILPSNYEPCGINQMIAMRYGSIPIVRAIGGLYDTVDNFDPATNKGTGFSFKHSDEFSFLMTVSRALENFKHKDTWKELIVRAMNKSSSWEIPARKYLELYKKALKVKEDGYVVD